MIKSFRFFLLLFGVHLSAVAQITAVNTIIGDESFVKTFGRAPDAGDDNWLRIRTHLAYAEKILRERDRNDLSPELQQKRLHLLDLLDQYVANGKFPENTDHPEGRRPCFIDAKGTICAVGYLVEQTEGRDKAAAINSNFQYATINEMHSEWLSGWLQRWGLSAEEAATIQPTYDWKYREPIKPVPVFKPVQPPKKFIRGNLQLTSVDFTRRLYPIAGLSFPKTDSVDLSYTVTSKGVIKKIRTDGGNAEMGKKIGAYLSTCTVTPQIEVRPHRRYAHYISARHQIRVVAGAPEQTTWPLIHSDNGGTIQPARAHLYGDDTLYLNLYNGGAYGDSCHVQFAGPTQNILLDTMLQLNQPHQLIVHHPATDRYCIYFSMHGGLVARSAYTAFFPHALLYYGLGSVDETVPGKDRKRYVIDHN